MNTTKQSTIIYWIIWAALLAAIFIYYVVMYFMVQAGDAPEDPDMSMITTMTGAFAAVSVMQGIGASVVRNAMFFRRFEAGGFESLLQLNAVYLTTSIVTWALVEAIAIYGFVLSILTYELIYIQAFSVPAVILMLFYRPRLVPLAEEYQSRYPDLGEENDEAKENPDSDAVW